jgi:hypothetical protein
MKVMYCFGLFVIGILNSVILYFGMLETQALERKDAFDIFRKIKTRAQCLADNKTKMATIRATLKMMKSILPDKVEESDEEDKSDEGDKPKLSCNLND